MDSGNTLCSAISLEFFLSLGFSRDDICPYPKKHVGTADKTRSLAILGIPPRRFKLRIGGILKNFPFTPIIIDKLASQVNISGPLMVELGLDQLHSEQCIQLMGKKVPLFSSPAGTPVESAKGAVYVFRKVRVPAKSISFVKLRCPKVELSLLPLQDGVLRASSLFLKKTQLLPWKFVAVRPDKFGHIIAGVMNVSDSPVVLPANVRFGSFHLLQNTSSEGHSNRLSAIMSPPSSHTSHPSKSTFNPTEKVALFQQLLQELKLQESDVLGDNPDITLRLKHLLFKYLDIFALNNETGTTDLVQHHIETTTNRPIMCRTRPINPAYDDSLKKQIAEWLRLKVIEPSNSPWNFCLLPVPKKSGEIRWVVDFRRLNDVTVKDSFPLPLIQDNLHRLGRSSIFSTLDGCQAFHTIPIAPEDRPKTAFSTPVGLFQFARLPFGLSNAPASYSRLVSKVLQSIPLSMALPYLDDVLVHSRTPEEHLEYLDKVLHAHKKAGLKLKPSKCFLFRKSVDYLGHRISAEGVATCPQYLEVIKTWPFPKTKAQIRTFIGKASYYRRFVRNFSRIAAPLIDTQTSLPTEKSEVPLTPAIQKAFHDLKAALLSAPILAYPDFSQSASSFIVDTDWSGDTNTIGGVLSQKQNGLERVIAYGSRKLTNSMKKYSPHKGELCGILFFLKYWKHFLQFRPFLLRTDHASLRYLRSMDPPTGMIARWLETLSNYQFTVQHRKGTLHANADALSRIHHAPDIPHKFVASPEIMGQLQPIAPWQELGQAQLTDITLGPLHTFLAKKAIHPDYSVKKFLLEEIEAPGLDLAIYLKLLPQLSCSDSVLMFTYPGSSVRVPCLPEKWWRKALVQAHDLNGHQGFDKTFATMKANVFFPDMRMLTMSHVNSCVDCQLKAHGPKPQKHTLRSLNAGFPFQKLCIDFVGPLPKTKHGNVYIFTVLDTFTKWLEAFPVPNCTAKTALSCLQTEIFSRFGFPQQIHSDNATVFTGTEFDFLTSAYNVHLSHTPKYHAASNAVERYHKDLNAMLRSYITDDPRTWDTALPQCLFALRSSLHGTTGYSPYELMFGRKPVIPLNLLAPLPRATFSSEKAYLAATHTNLQQAFKKVRSSLKLAVMRQKQYHYKKKQKLFQVNDKVWLFSATKPRKYHCGWSGPWTVSDLVSDVVVTLKPDPLWKLDLQSLTVSIDRIKLHAGSVANIPPLDDHDLFGISDFFLEGPFGPKVHPPFDKDSEGPAGGPPPPPQPNNHIPPQPEYDHQHFHQPPPEPAPQEAQEEAAQAPEPNLEPPDHDNEPATADAPQPNHGPIPPNQQAHDPWAHDPEHYRIPSPPRFPSSSSDSPSPTPSTPTNVLPPSPSPSNSPVIMPAVSPPLDTFPFGAQAAADDQPMPGTSSQYMGTGASGHNGLPRSGDGASINPFRGRTLGRSPGQCTTAGSTNSSVVSTHQQSVNPVQAVSTTSRPLTIGSAASGADTPGNSTGRGLFVLPFDQRGASAIVPTDFGQPAHTYHYPQNSSRNSIAQGNASYPRPQPHVPARGPTTRSASALQQPIAGRTRSRSRAAAESTSPANVYARKYKSTSARTSIPSSSKSTSKTRGTKPSGGPKTKSSGYGQQRNSDRRRTSLPPQEAGPSGYTFSPSIPRPLGPIRESGGAPGLLDGRSAQGDADGPITGQQNRQPIQGSACLSGGGVGGNSMQPAANAPSTGESYEGKEEKRPTGPANAGRGVANSLFSDKPRHRSSSCRETGATGGHVAESRGESSGFGESTSPTLTGGQEATGGLEGDPPVTSLGSTFTSTLPQQSFISQNQSSFSSSREQTSSSGEANLYLQHGYPLAGAYPFSLPGQERPGSDGSFVDVTTTPARDQATIFAQEPPWTPDMSGNEVATRNESTSRDLACIDSSPPGATGNSPDNGTPS